MDAICKLKFAKGHKSVQIVGGVMVFFQSTLSENALYINQCLPSIS